MMMIMTKEYDQDESRIIRSNGRRRWRLSICERISISLSNGCVQCWGWEKPIGEVIRTVLLVSVTELKRERGEKCVKESFHYLNTRSIQCEMVSWNDAYPDLYRWFNSSRRSKPLSTKVDDYSRGKISIEKSFIYLSMFRSTRSNRDDHIHYISK